MEIIPYSPGRARQIVDLFCRAVHAIDDSVYTRAQKLAWAPLPPDYVTWAARLAVKRPSLAVIDNRVVGFIELDPGGHIDCTYVDPDYQGRGVASRLYRQLETAATGCQLTRLHVEVSRAARPFFERMGFVMQGENVVERNGQLLTNFRMVKSLTD